MCNHLRHWQVQFFFEDLHENEKIRNFQEASVENGFKEHRRKDVFPPRLPKTSRTALSLQCILACYVLLHFGSKFEDYTVMHFTVNITYTLTSSYPALYSLALCHNRYLFLLL